MAIILTGLTGLRVAYDGLHRFVSGTDGTNIYVQRFLGNTSTEAPWSIGGSPVTRVTVAAGSEASIDYFQDILIIDIAGVGTYSSTDSGKTWQVR